MNEYLYGVLILAVIWLILVYLRKDLVKPMVWSGGVYVLILTIGFIILKILSSFTYIGPQIVPGYWDPETLFDLGRLTGGWAIEDILFMFFAGGIATAVYEVLTKERIGEKKNPEHHYRALIVALLASAVFALVMKINLIYALIFFGAFGALWIWIERKDLIKHSAVGALAFVIVYFAAFSLFNVFFPEYVTNVYNLSGISGVLVGTVPLEELLFAVSFGAFWAPIYEYEHGDRDFSV